MSFAGLFDDGSGAGLAADIALSSSADAFSDPCLAFSSAGLSLNLKANTEGQQEISQKANMEGQQEISRVAVVAIGCDGDIDLVGLKKEDENDSRSGSDHLGGVSGDDADQENPPKKKQRYHRHTPHQIQELEAFFKEFPHPDEKQRLALGNRLRLESRQVKFWFQNKRTQMKTQIERHENTILRQENEKLKAENITFREAMRNPICSNCSGPAMLGEASLEEQHLKIENARLKDELDRVCALAGKFLRRSISTPILPQAPSSSLELAVGKNGFSGLASVSTTLPAVTDFVAGVSSPLSTVLSPPARAMGTTGVDGSVDRSIFLELALSAIDELVKMVQMSEPLWVPSMEHGREKLNFEEYLQVFPRCIGPKPDEFVSEATRETGVVIINSLALMESLMDATRWADMFPGIIAGATTTDMISGGLGGTRNGALQLMHAELQVLSPLVPVRDVNFLRFCKQPADGVWAIVDVSIDGIRENPSAVMGSMKCRRLPSGCVVQDMPNGYSKITWVEHAEYDEAAVHPLYRPLLRSGLGLGAPRWLAALQRQCECLAVLMSSSAAGDLTGMVTAGGRRSMLKLAARMTSNFSAGVCTSSAREWSRLSAGGIGEDVRVMTRQSVDDPGEPAGVVLSAATSVWLPVAPHRLLAFLRDERLRSEWDILSNGGPMQEMAHIAKGPDPGNAVSLLRASAVSGKQGSSMLILQETCTDAAASMVVYAPVDVPAMHLVLSGGDPGCVALLPSGFAVLPDWPGIGGQHKVMGGSLLTVGFQILVNSLPTAKLTVESVETVNSLISCTVQKIKAALYCEN